MGFCIFNNIAISAEYARAKYNARKICIVDYDVHHGNGTQEHFYERDDVLFISIHQDGNYPLKSGSMKEIGSGRGEGKTINVPLPPGSGHGAYMEAFKSVVTPAVNAFAPDLILVSSGFDASYMDPLARMMLSSESFRLMARSLVALADTHCRGRIAFFHEGGYSEVYVPFCGLAVVEELGPQDGHRGSIFGGSEFVGIPGCDQPPAGNYPKGERTRRWSVNIFIKYFEYFCAKVALMKCESHASAPIGSHAGNSIALLARTLNMFSDRTPLFTAI